jgi:hypothetical protein
METAVDDKDQVKGGPEKDADDTEDTEGNMHPGPRGEKQPTSGGENPTGRDDDAGEGGDNFHPRPFHPRP